ncbi:M48 family metalloprotease [Zooshikella harenae]|uniref:M48 family metalloprotease n=1 Tax=Zooshikella harenae TaxID=2827238 RepID=A0ABS5Z6A2_9GAMM|nr:M48 family metalloprotease [Zooshikella harenae]MBU2709579.1 M48 family metalloprotease [Zooshikella harenae]
MKRIISSSYPCKNLILVLLVGSCFCFSGCAVNPATGDYDFVLMSEQDEQKVGRKNNQQIRKQLAILDTQKLQRYVQEVGLKVARVSHRPSLPYQFKVIDSPEVNAFALPGGYIYVYRGLLAYLNSEAELAAVLAHEVAHVTARHSVQQHGMSTASNVFGQVVAAYTGIGVAGDLTNILGTAVVRGYGREHELEADGLGASYLAKAGYNPQAMINVVKILKHHEMWAKKKAEAEGREVSTYHGIFSTHPENDTRLHEVVTSVSTQSQGYVFSDRYLQKINGLAFGESVNSGVTVNNQFLHKPMNFKLRFPRHWKIINTHARLVAHPIEKEAVFVMEQGPIKNGFRPDAYLKSLAGQRYRLRGGESIRIGNTIGYTAVIQPKLGGSYIRLAILFHQGKVFILQGQVKQSSAFASYDVEFLQIIKSFQLLPLQDYQRAEGNKLTLIKVKPGITFSELAKRSSLREHAELQLRLINDMYPKGEPKVGQWLKVIK